ncbi:LOW QUALITY PROTEIN: hypothetical protein CFC21_001661 [Triticum aestivum]|uniref:Uncharacterized protein n=1 Tax=Triticum aestivum TaxID=4565 RepID=A0A3B5XYF0_WHEAT|nr:LOW QUALITY PROTEIN: hypothetical protein CFC21_001661 [Triticum aestivum]
MIICEEYVFNSMYVNSRVERSMSTKSRTLSISGTGFLSIKKKIISYFITIRTAIYYLPIYLPGLVVRQDPTLLFTPLLQQKWIHHLLPMSNNVTNLPLIPRASMKKRVKQGRIRMFHLSKPLMPCAHSFLHARWQISQPGVYSRPRSLA